MTPEWAALMQTYDQTILLMFVGVCAFALNWYAFESKPAIQRVMAWAPLLLSGVIIALEIASGVKA